MNKNKHQIQNLKYQISTNTKIQNNFMENSGKIYDLEERTLVYSKRIIKMCQTLQKNANNNILLKQVLRSGTSMGANYREANETETKKDFKFRIRICRKEGKETVYWLNLIIDANPDFKKRIEPLLEETKELVKIFAAILLKSV